MRKIKSNQFILNSNYLSTTSTSSLSKFDHLNLIQTFSNLKNSKKDNRNIIPKSRIPGNHPLKLFIDFSNQHQFNFKSYTKSCSFWHHSLLQSRSFHHHNHHHHDHHQLSSYSSSTDEQNQISNSQSPSSFSSHVSPLDSQNSSDPSHKIQTSWWQFSSKPIEPDRPALNLKNPSTNFKQRSIDEISQSFQNYTFRVSQLQSSHSSSSSSTTSSRLITLNKNLETLLNDHHFQEDFNVIWSDLTTIEQTSNDVHLKFQVVEFQRKSIEILFNTLINSVTTCSQSEFINSSPGYVQNKNNIFNQVIHFLIVGNCQQRSNKVISILGLDPIVGWRNLVKQHLRIRTLKSLISFINLFNPKISSWWAFEFNRAKDDPFKMNQLAQTGSFLISALSKQGSVWMAFQLFWLMNKLPQSHQILSDWKSVQPISHQRRAATALGLVDALISRKKVDYANQILETISIGEWIGGTIYRRYLLNILNVKGARGELSSVERIGLTYERAWVNSNVMTESTAAGRNKRSRGFHIQDPRILVARAKIQALGMLGETSSAMKVFQEIISTVPTQFSISSQLPDLYAEIMRVHLKADDPRCIEKLLKRMKVTPNSYGFNQPDQRHFNILLQAYANRLDIEACSSVLDQLITSGIPPDIYTYGNICLLFSNLGESDFIRQVIESLAKIETPHHSIRLNRELWNILLDAYIESGDWNRAAKLLEFLQVEDKCTKQFDVVTNGSVLKALVVSGSPTDKVLKTFMSMYNTHTGIVADARSYTLLLLSICDAGMMDLAESLFYALKDSARRGEKQGKAIRDSVQPNVYMYGIMISAFLRIGKPDLAQGYLREMQRSGIRPSLVIYSMLTNAYATSKLSGMKNYSWNEIENQEQEEERQQDGVLIAHEMASQFRRELLDNEAHLKGFDHDKFSDKIPQENFYWGELPIIRKRLSHRLLGPIIQSYAKSARPAKALELLRELISSLGSDYNGDGKTIDIDIFTMLMDAYRRAQDPVGVIEVWNEIFRIATKNESPDASKKLLNKILNLIETGGRERDERDISKNRELTHDQIQRRQANKLCLPLSIYTDCLSRHGYHEEIAKTWQQVQESGFGFDAGNWNELCAAMFRSGNHKMGWWITETVFFTKDQVKEDYPVTTLENNPRESLKWAKILNQTIEYRAARAAIGLEGTRLDGAKKVESPLRPPNRTSKQTTQRFDDELSVRNLLESLLKELKGKIKDEETYDPIHHDMNPRMSWSQQLNDISQTKRDFEWKPYEKVLRMLHGSMWRECTQVITKKWEEEQRKVDKMQVERIEKEGDSAVEKFEQSMQESVKEIIDNYEDRYPHVMIQVLAMNDSTDIPTGLSDKELFSWNKRDFVLRVINRTIQRILD